MVVNSKIKKKYVTENTRDIRWKREDNFKYHDKPPRERGVSKNPYEIDHVINKIIDKVFTKKVMYFTIKLLSHCALTVHEKSYYTFIILIIYH